MGEYHDLYLTIDVFLLADIFENFRDTCLKYYGLDPQHYLSSPSLAWDSALNNKEGVNKRGVHLRAGNHAERFLRR